MGHKFSLVLSREITDEESAALQADCAGAAFAADSHPTNADVTVTRVDFDDTASSSLADAIKAGLEAAKRLPDLSIPSLTVPAQPAPGQAADAQAADEEQPESAAESPAAEPGTAQTAGTAKDAASTTPSPDNEPELVQAGASS